MGTGSHNEDIAIATTTRLQGMVTTALNRYLASTILTNYPGPHTSECIATLTTQQRMHTANESIGFSRTHETQHPSMAGCVFPAGGHLRTGCKVNQVPSPRCDHAWHRRTRCPDHSNICKSSVFDHTLDDSDRVRINWKR